MPTYGMHLGDLTLLTERSFDESHVPAYFRMVFPLTGEPYAAKALPQLLDRKLVGVEGISDTGKITWQYLQPGSHRNALLMMPGQKTVAMNKLTRIMYGNPHYLISKNCQALQRIWQKGSGEACMDNLFRGGCTYLKKNFNTLNPKQKEWARAVVAAEGYSGVPMALDTDLEGKKWETVKDLATLWKGPVKKWLDYMRDSRNAKDIEPMTIQDWMFFIEGAAKNTADVYGDEGEWIVKDKTLIVPPGSRLTIVVPTVPPEAQAEWDADKQNPGKKGLLASYSWTDRLKGLDYIKPAIAQLKQAGYLVFEVADKNLKKGYDRETNRRMQQNKQAKQATAVAQVNQPTA